MALLFAGEPMYESCYKKVEKVLYNKIKKAEEVKNMDFYAFSYYYDRAVDISAIGRNPACLSRKAKP